MTHSDATEKATARPWMVDPDDSKQVIDRYSNFIAEGFALGLVQGDDATAIANATLIVQAVNSYDAMREALNVALDWADRVSQHRDATQPIKDAMALIADKARAALASAKP